MQTTNLALVERPTGVLRAAKIGPSIFSILSVGGIVRDCADCANLAA